MKIQIGIQYSNTQNTWLVHIQILNTLTEWPEEDDWSVQQEAKDIIAALLQQNPLDRLGVSGSIEVKEHHYFNGMDWNALLRMKADFIPQLEDEEDTSYFDMRLDR